MRLTGGKVHVAPCWNSDARLVNAQNRYTLKMYNKARLNLLFDNERKLVPSALSLITAVVTSQVYVG